MKFCDFFCNSKNLTISLLFISQKAVKAQIIAKIMEKMMPIEKKYNFIDFLIKFYFIDFLSKYDQKCHENQHQLEKKGSVDDFDFQVFHLHWVTCEKTSRVYGATFILTLRRLQRRCEQYAKSFSTRNLFSPNINYLLEKLIFFHGHWFYGQ